MAIKIKLSQPYYDVLTCDEKNLIFSSDINTFKIKKVVDFSVTVSSGTGTATVDHDLGYIPIAYGYIKDASGRWWTDHRFAQDWADAEITTFKMVVDNDKVYITAAGDDATYTGKAVLMENIV